jgi:hypothetical protein
MAGLEHLFDVYNKQGKQFIDELFNKELIVSEKPDGCLKYDTMLETEDGFKTIQEICETLYLGKVKTYCTETDTIVWDKVVDHLIKDDINKQWFELETEMGNYLTVTGNHKIFCSETNYWKRVDELKVNDLLQIQEFNFRIKKLTKLETLYTCYDITTEKYHSFFANNILVHNSVFSVQQNESGKLDFFKRDDRQPISQLDRTILSLYEPPIEFIENRLGNEKLPTNLRFGFEYFQNKKPVSIAYDTLPKNRLVLTHMKEFDSNGKVQKFIDDPAILKKWATKFDVEEPFIIFNGKLSEKQKLQLIDFLNTPFGDLVDKFKTMSFTRFIISILNPKLNKTALNDTLDKPIEGLVFKFNDGEFLGKVVDPLFTQMAKDKAKQRIENTDGAEEFSAVLYTFITWIEEKNKLKNIKISGSSEEERYIDLISELVTSFIADNKVFLKSLNIKKQDYAKAPEFDLNTKFLKNPDIVQFIKNNKDSEDIYRIILTSFRKVRKRTTNKIDENLIKQMNLVIRKIQEITSPVNESFLTFKEWKALVEKSTF